MQPSLAEQSPPWNEVLRFWDSGDFASAEALIEEGLREQPTSHAVRFIVALRELEHGPRTGDRRQRVKKLVEEALAGVEGDAALRIAAAVLLSRIGEMSEAADHVKAAHETAADLTDRHTLATMAHVTGLIVQSRGNLPSAIEQLRLATETDPSNSDHALVLAEMLRRDRQFDAANTVIARGLVNDPSHPGLLRLAPRA